MPMNPSRRNLLKMGGAALAMIPVVAVAAKNDSIRTTMRYKDSPEGDKKCSDCGLFVAGASATAPGSCKVFPGDTEISPNGYCMAWAKKG
jgi:hypothetical protein